ncbi:MAG TPA: hypothetical protein VIO14_06315 [Dehalococcoidia bacterium]
MPGKRTRRPVSAQAFYERALTEAEREALAAAREVEGLDQEIAVLRAKLWAALQEHPEDLPLMYRGLDLLIRAVRTRYRISQEDGETLGERAAALLRQMGDLLHGEDGHDG